MNIWQYGAGSYCSGDIIGIAYCITYLLGSSDTMMVVVVMVEVVLVLGIVLYI